MESVFYVLVLAALFSSACGLSVQKVVEPSCRVITDHGELDLTPVAHKDGPAFTYIDQADQVKFMWNPCYDVKPEGCSTPGELFLYAGINSAFEISARDASTSTTPPNPVTPCEAIGTKANSNFKVENGALVLNYLYTTAPQLTFKVELKCTSADTTSFSAVENDNGVFNLLVSSYDEESRTSETIKCSNAIGHKRFSHDWTNHSETTFIAGIHGTASGKAMCLKSSSGGQSGGLSGGSVLLIIALVLVVLYVVVGILIMKFVKKAQGPELCPNVGFWKSLPFLVKDGVMFTVTCGRKSASYDNI